MTADHGVSADVAENPAMRVADAAERYGRLRADQFRLEALRAQGLDPVVIRRVMDRRAEIEDASDTDEHG